MMMHGAAAGAGRGRINRLIPNAGAPTKKADAQTVRRVARSFKPYWRQVLVVLLAILLTGVLGVVNPYMLKFSISIGFAQQNFHLLAIFVGVMILTPIISSLIGIGQTYLNTVIG